MQEVTGLIVAFDRETLTIDLQGESRNLPMENVHGILLATPLLAEDEREITEVHLNGGSTLVAEIQSLKKGNLNLLLIESTPLELSWSDVRSLTIRSALLVYLSDLQPSVVNHEPILALPREW